MSCVPCEWPQWWRHLDSHRHTMALHCTLLSLVRLYTLLYYHWPGFTLYSAIIGQALHTTILPTTQALQRALQQPHLLTFFPGSKVLLTALLTEVPHCSSSRSRLLYKLQSPSSLVQDLFIALHILVLTTVNFLIPTLLLGFTFYLKLDILVIFLIFFKY